MDFDRQRLQQVLLNLAKNAIKFSHVGGENITIMAKVVPKPDHINCFQLEVSVADRGIGIPASEVKHIFTPLFRT